MISQYFFEGVSAREWARRAIEAERQAAAAMDCLKKLGGPSVPEPWRDVAQAGYIGCGGEWPRHLNILD